MPVLTIENSEAYRDKGTVESGRIDRERQTEKTQTQDGNSFLELVEKSMEKVNQYQVQADQAVRELVAGRTKNIHESMLAIERADLSLKLMVQTRNKILDAYREIMRMQM